MKHIKLFENFDKSYSASYVANQIKHQTPEPDDVPHHFIDLIKRSKNKFILKKVNIQDIINTDPSVKEYVDSGVERYDQDDIDPNQVYEPIVIFNGEVFDGYSRISTLYNMGDEEIDAFVNI